MFNILKYFRKNEKKVVVQEKPKLKTKHWCTHCFDTYTEGFWCHYCMIFACSRVYGLLQKGEITEEQYNYACAKAEYLEDNMNSNGFVYDPTKQGKAW